MVQPEAITLIVEEARTGQDALVRYQDQVVEQGGERPSEGEARAALFAAVASMGWALLLAPELWTALEAWWACRRLSDDLEQLRTVRDHVAAATLAPSILPILEMKTGKTFALPADGQYVGEVKIGPDVLAVRASAVAKVAAEITRAEAELARAQDRFTRRTAAYRDTAEDLANTPLVDICRRLLRGAISDRDLALARACVEVMAGPKTLLETSGDDLMGGLEERLRAKGIVPGQKAPSEKP